MANSGSWVVEMEKMIGDDNTYDDPPTRRPFIYRVPKYIKEMTNPSAYKPQLMSLGPFHHGDEALLPMEAHKRRATVHRVKRSGRPLREFIGAVEEIAGELRAAYENLQDEEKWRGDRFVEMMITDGCFLLELMRMFVKRGKVDKDYGTDDAVFSEHGYLYLRFYIISDVLMIENQVPLLLLRTLLHVDPGADSLQEDQVINNWVLDSIGMLVTPVNDNLGLHPLDVVHKSICGPHHDRKESSEDEIGIPCAAELHEAGIHFKLSDAEGFIGAVSFKNGVLTMPSIVVSDTTERLFLNLLAFEQLHPGAGNNVMAFIFFMDNVINTAKDVELLRSKGIIDNIFGSDEAVAHLFNNLNKGAVMSPCSSLLDVQQEMNAHCKKRRNKWRAILVHTYFSNPWVFISLVAAFILLVATVLQTIYTIVQSYKS